MPLGSLQDAATPAVLYGEGRVVPVRSWGVAKSRWRWGVSRQRWSRGRSHKLCGEVGRKAECGKSARSV
jgi:hypothetical protein